MAQAQEAWAGALLPGGYPGATVGVPCQAQPGVCTEAHTPELWPCFEQREAQRGDGGGRAHEHACIGPAAQARGEGASKLPQQGLVGAQHGGRVGLE